MSDLTTTDKSTKRVQTQVFYFGASGLRPNTKHTFYIDGVNHNFAARQYGKDFGDDLISDSSGELHIEYLMEFSYNRDQNFELPEQQTLSYQTGQLQASQQSNKVARNYVLIEVKSVDGLSYAQHMKKINRILTAGNVRTLYSIE